MITMSDGSGQTGGLVSDLEGKLGGTIFVVDAHGKRLRDATETLVCTYPDANIQSVHWNKIRNSLGFLHRHEDIIDWIVDQLASHSSDVPPLVVMNADGVDYGLLTRVAEATEGNAYFLVTSCKDERTIRGEDDAIVGPVVERYGDIVAFTQTFAYELETLLRQSTTFEPSPRHREALRLTYFNAVTSGLVDLPHGHPYAITRDMLTKAKDDFEKNDGLDRRYQRITSLPGRPATLFPRSAKRLTSLRAYLSTFFGRWYNILHNV